MKESIISELSFQFSLNIIELYKQLRSKKEYVISKQLLKSGTSIGANVVEAGAGQSKKDFLSKMSITSKEARETKYWLQLLDKSQLVEINVTGYLSTINDIINILTKIVKTTSSNISK